MLELQPHGFWHIFFSNKGMACGLGAARCFINLVVIALCVCVYIYNPVSWGFWPQLVKTECFKSNRLEFLY